MTRQPDASIAFRLRAMIGGGERLFFLKPGENRIGSTGDNDVVLPVAGVSRHHARLVVRSGTLLLEDLESRNGTAVAGRRFTRGEVVPGTEIRFGPLAAVVEKIAADDARLGLTLLPAPSQGGLAIETTTEVVPEAPAGTESPETERPAAKLAFPEGFVAGLSPAMGELYEELEPLIDSDLPILIVGETGVGKEQVARIVHGSSRRRDGPYVALNCAAIPAELLEAEMFGIGKGVATGVAKRPGRLREASGGTLFLDEIGDMSRDLQAKLLRALQEKEIYPLGEGPVQIDVRVVAATHRDLLERVDSGSFRRDLYYRVAGAVVRVPPLRERPEDVPLLIEHFLRGAAQETGQVIHGVTVRALEYLTSHSWPGNVRELEHEISRLAHRCAGARIIDSESLSEELRKAWDGAPASPAERDSLRLADQVRETERRAILRALEHAGGSRRKAAPLLGISRTTLLRKIRELDISI